MKKDKIDKEILNDFGKTVEYQNLINFMVEKIRNTAFSSSLSKEAKQNIIVEYSKEILRLIKEY